MAIWAWLMKDAKARRLRYGSNSAMEIRGLLSVEVPIKNFQKIVQQLTISNLATNVILIVAFTEKYAERTSPEASHTTSITASPISIVNETWHDFVLTINAKSDRRKDEKISDEDCCVVTEAMSHSPIILRIVEMSFNCGYPTNGYARASWQKKTNPGHIRYSWYSAGSFLPY